MYIIEMILGITYLSYVRGKNDGKWGCFTIMMLFLLWVFFKLFILQ